MFSYAFKNLRALFTRQRLLGFLLLLNIVASAAVICFSYGVYRNYEEIRVREEIKTAVMELDVYMQSDSFQPMFADPDNWKYGFFTDQITPQMLTDLLREIPDSIRDNIACIDVQFWLRSPVSYLKGFNIDDWVDYSERDDYLYSDDASPFWWPVRCSFKLLDDKIVDAEDEKFFTYDQYNSGEKIVMISNLLYEKQQFTEHATPPSVSYIAGMPTEKQSVEFFFRLIPFGTDSLMFGGERYEIAKAFNFAKITDNVYDSVKIPVTAIPEGAMISCSLRGYNDDDAGKVLTGKGAEATVFTIHFKDYATDKQCEKIAEKIKEIMGDNVYPETLAYMKSRETDYINTVVALTVFIGLLAAINMAILYRYILEKRSSELAIFRICGCTQEQAILSYLIECLIINAPVFALTELIYHIFIRTQLKGIFPYIAGVYNCKFYSLVFVMYVCVSAFIMYRMIKSTVNKHSLIAMKNTKRATNRFGAMKALEITQLAAIMTILIIIVSTVSSGQEFFRPYEEYLSRKGYLTFSPGTSTSPDEFESMTDGADRIMSYYRNIDYFDMESEEHTYFDAIAYPDEFIDIYTPQIVLGSWLSEIDETYESTGYIPAIVSENFSYYSVGTILPDDIIEDYSPDGVVRYKIVGVFKDNSKLISYLPMSFHFKDYEIDDYMSMFNMFSVDNEPNSFLLTKASDMAACYGDAGSVRGAQLVLCDDMPDAKYKAIGETLSKHESISFEELSVVYEQSKLHIYQQMYSLLPVAVCIFIMTLISAISINAIYTKRQLRNYAIFYICGAKWSRCALMSLRNGVMTCIAASAMTVVGVILSVSLFGDTVVTFGMRHLIICASVMLLYLILSMIMPLSIIGSTQPREVLKEE